MGEQSETKDGYRVLSMVIAGPLFYGAVGWGVGQWLNAVWPLPVGIVLGAAASVYMVVARYRSTE